MSALHDDETGLLNEPFLRALLPGRVATAKRMLWPLSLVLCDNDNDATVGVVTHAIVLTVRECDVACRLDDGRFALLLEDTPEDGALWVTERIRRLLGAQTEPVTLWAGVSTYPVHARDATGLLTTAGRALDAALEWRTPRIEVAAPLDDG